MENMDVCSSRSKLEALSGIEDVEKILQHRKDNTKSYNSTRGEMFDSDSPAGPSIQASMVEKDSDTAEFDGSFSSQAVLQLLVGTKLRDLDSLALEGAMMKGAKETLAEVVISGFLDADFGLKQEFFRFNEMTSTGMIHDGSMDIIIHRSFEH